MLVENTSQSVLPQAARDWTSAESKTRAGRLFLHVGDNIVISGAGIAGVAEWGGPRA